MNIIEKFKKSSLLKYGTSALAGSALTFAAVATVFDVPKFDMHGFLGIESKSFDPINSTNDLSGRPFQSRFDREPTFETAVNEVSFYAGGIYLVYDPNDALGAQIVMPSEGNVGLPDISGGVVQFDAYSDAVQSVIENDQSRIEEHNLMIEELNSLSEGLTLDEQDPNAVRVVTLMSNIDNDFVTPEKYRISPVGFKTLAVKFGENVGGYDGNSIYRLESATLGFGCTLTLDDKTGNLVGQVCRSDWGKKKEAQFLAKLDN